VCSAKAHSLRSNLVAGLDQTDGDGLIYAELNGLADRVKLILWLSTLPDPVPSAAITSVSSSRSPKAVGRPNPFTVVVPHVVMRSPGL
jgi:hypothetical protein